MDSILTSIKKNIGITEEDTSFDPDVIMHINSVFAILTQLGVGPSEGFYIVNEDAIWDDFIPPNPRLAMVKTYMSQKVRLMLDLPQSSTLIQEIKEQIKELEWRLAEAAELEIQNGGE